MTLEDLDDARTMLTHARAQARAAARKVTREITQPAQDAVDAAVLVAVAGGATKTAVAAFLGESRTTINERLARATGGVTKQEVEDVVQTHAPLTYLIDGDKLHVDWRNYGPDRVTAKGTMEIVYDTDDDTYWFLPILDDVGYTGRTEVHSRLDTTFTGWYYTDAAATVKNLLQNPEEE